MTFIAHHMQLSCFIYIPYKSLFNMWKNIYSLRLIILFQATKQLTVSNVKAMRMNDDVLVVAISPDAKYIAVALLDSTVKVRFINPILFALCVCVSMFGFPVPNYLSLVYKI